MKMYDVFISYSRRDYLDEKRNVIPGNVVSKIKAVLDENNISYWFDEDGIYSGQNFIEKIVTNIKASHIFLYLSTSNANASRWTCKEIASAEELGKHIIPLRIDDSPYNDKVLFRISDLDYIEYYTNPEKAMKDLVVSIKAYLTQIEKEKKRKREEQDRLIAEIRLECTTLNNEETRIGLERNKLALMTEQLTDDATKEELKEFVQKSSPSFQEFQKEKEELLNNMKKKEDECRQLNDELLQTKELLRSKTAPVRKLHIRYCCALFAMLLACIFYLYITRPDSVNKPSSSPETSSDSIVSQDTRIVIPDADTLSVDTTSVQPVTSLVEIWRKGKEYYNKGQKKDAIGYLLQAAEMGSDSAQFMLGECYYYGQGTSRNHKEAVKWYQKAANQGNRNAECSLGTCYEYGVGVPQNKDEARKWYERAAAKGDKDAAELLKRLGK